MRPFKTLPIVIPIDDKGGIGKSLIAAVIVELCATASPVGRDDGPIPNSRKRKGAPSGPRRRTKKRRV